ncbi:MAG: hypothetical protein K8T25_09425 [Planctomycetia bacterium]|nr:hypothetical protein [Planctomycetia bacterium]
MRNLSRQMLWRGAKFFFAVACVVSLFFRFESADDIGMLYCNGYGYDVLLTFGVVAVCMGDPGYLCLPLTASIAFVVVAPFVNFSSNESGKRWKPALICIGVFSLLSVPLLLFTSQQTYWGLWVWALGLVGILGSAMGERYAVG